MIQAAELRRDQKVMVPNPDDPNKGYVGALVDTVNEVTGWAIVSIDGCRKTHVKVSAIHLPEA